MHGWYSLEDYKKGCKEYIYLDNYGQETYCTLITKDKNLNSENNKKLINKELFYCGTLKYFVKIKHG
tara:strand:- start:279 stop:479 length:201 start_codon:yes stop_codon:yes gene_type:complete